MYFTQFSIQVQYGLVIPPIGGVASFNLLTAGRDRYLQILQSFCWRWRYDASKLYIVSFSWFSQRKSCTYGC